MKGGPSPRDIHVTRYKTPRDASCHLFGVYFPIPIRSRSFHCPRFSGWWFPWGLVTGNMYVPGGWTITRRLCFGSLVSCFTIKETPLLNLAVMKLGLRGQIMARGRRGGREGTEPTTGVGAPIIHLPPASFSLPVWDREGVKSLHVMQERLFVASVSPYRGSW
jgi:hypothetical protein